MADIYRSLAQSNTFVLFKGNIESVPGSLSDLSLERTTPFASGSVVEEKYRIVKIIGEGGMGTVYHAHHLSLDREVALKTFRTADLSPESWERFKREVQAIAKLDSKRIVRVFDFGVSEGNRPYYTMELLSGESLAERLARLGPQSVRQTMKIFSMVAEGMVVAHARGIVHRDLKPGNIFLELQDDKVAGVKVVDFGIAKLVNDTEEKDQSLTGDVIFGSPLYMSPEQSLGQQIDERCDIYSYGCALYETLTGRPPYIGDSAIATIMCHQNDALPRLSTYAPGKDFPHWLEVLIARVLAKDKKARINNFQEIIDVITYNLDARPAEIVTNHERQIDSAAAESEGNRYSPRRVMAAVEESASDRSAVPDPPSNILIYAMLAAVSLVVIGTALGYIYRDKLFAPGQNLLAIFPAPQNTGSALFYRGTEASADGAVKVFDFGAKSVGKFVFVDQPVVDCVGVVRVPASEDIIFECGDAVLDGPDILQRFRPDDLTGLQFNEDLPFSNLHIMQAGRLSGLRLLTANRARVNNSCNGAIGSLANLQRLELNDTAYTGADIANLRNFMTIESFSLSRLSGINTFLAEAARRKHKCTALTLKDCALTDEDMVNVARLDNLRTLVMNVNDVTSAGINKLLVLPHLINLYIEQCPLGPGAMPVLKRFSGLRVIELTYDEVSPDDVRILKKALPDCQVRVDQPSKADR